MLILNYLKLKNGLLDLNSTLSLHLLLSWPIVRSRRLQNSNKKRGQYKKYHTNTASSFKLLHASLSQLKVPPTIKSTSAIFCIVHVLCTNSFQYKKSTHEKFVMQNILKLRIVFGFLHCRQQIACGYFKNTLPRPLYH